MFPCRDIFIVELKLKKIENLNESALEDCESKLCANNL